VYFENPRPGNYHVAVVAYDLTRTGSASPYRVTVRREGKPDQVFTGTARTNKSNQGVTEVNMDEP
jgi:hypothetical protein